MPSSPERQRQRRSTRQCSCLLTRITVRVLDSASRIDHTARRREAIGANAWMKVSGCQGSRPFSMARRAKNQPVLTSVYWLTSSRLPPCCAIAPVICASSPTASGQLSLRIETMPENKSLPVGAFARKTGCSAKASYPGPRERFPLERRIELDRRENRVADRFQCRVLLFR